MNTNIPFSSPYRVTFGQPAAPYRGVYINLDARADRRAAMDEQFRKFGLADNYQRFSAVEASTMKSMPQGISAAEAACFWSHYRAIRQAMGQARAANACIHVLEDDAILSPHVKRTIENGHREAQFDQFDIVFTETFVGYNAWNLRDFKQFHDLLTAQRRSNNDAPAFAVADITSVYLACMSSYIVAPHAVERVTAILKQELDVGPRMPIDLLVRREAGEGRLKLGCMFPFTTTIRLDQIHQSTINTFDSQAESLSRLAAALLRYSFFVDRDFDAYARPWLDAIAAARATRNADRHLQVMTEMLGFVMSNGFKPF